mmetsp:Transcript_6657/g.9662  ORF Transcript_6657/g.9662 Transcript_6657/m.9662 type:complete len:782 (+) Transcript_6657:73-2418(+)
MTKISIFAAFALLLGSCHGDRERLRHKNGLFFNRIATLAVCVQIDLTCDTDTVTNAEIVTATADGMTVIYTAGLDKSIGFVDITDPSQPLPIGYLGVDGEPTSVAALGNKYVLACVNTSDNYIDTSGVLLVIEVATRTIVASHDLGGQPDSIKVSKDGNYAIILIENERDESLNNGDLPQSPAGYVVIADIDVHTDPQSWVLQQVAITGLPGVDFPEDPEPEFADINKENIAVVTLQENNALVLIDLKLKTVISSFTAGTATVSEIDTSNNKLIELIATRTATREPDGVAWIDEQYFVTADEGDWKGGTRTFTIFDSTDGSVVFSSSDELDHLVARIGGYPDKRNKKGNEPENVAVAIFDGIKYLFVNSERSSVVFVYRMESPTTPIFHQILPTGTGPEGGVTIPFRGLYIVASEVDSRSTGVRSSIAIFKYGYRAPEYPTLASFDRGDTGTPIPFAALSSLAAETRDVTNSHYLYSTEDSFFKKNRIFKIDKSLKPPKITSEQLVQDTNDILANVSPQGQFSAEDLAALINPDKTVNLDLEGIAVAWPDGFWLAHEGAGTFDDSGKPVLSLNFLLKVSAAGVIQKVVTLPEELNNIQVRYGFEGVAEGTGPFAGNVCVIFQRAWGTESNPRIGWYNVANDEWKFFFYPLDTEPAPRNEGWVGLSDVAPLKEAQFFILERDNQAGPDALIKRVYKIDLSDAVENEVLTKIPILDLLPALKKAKGLVPEKMEGLAVTAKNEIFVLNDNDGVDSVPSETRLTLVKKGFSKKQGKNAKKKGGKH